MSFPKYPEYKPSGVDPVAMPRTAFGLVLSTSTTMCAAALLMCS